MSLGRLLSSGKSLIGLNSVTNRYRMESKNLLPKFGSMKNPFSTKPKSAVVSKETDPPVPAPAPMPVETAVATELKETVRPPAALPSPTGEGEVSGASKRMSIADRIGGWLGRINLFAWWSARKRAKSKPAIPAFNKGPVQGELSLDNIKVVRNDLNDADIEVVSATVTAKANPAPGKVAGPAVEKTPELLKI